MNMFNRIIVSILMLCIVVFCIVAIVNTFANLFEWSDVSDRIIDSAHNLNRFVLGAILFLIFAIALIIFIFEIYRKRAKTANIAADSSGKSMLTIRTTEEQIKTSLGRINDVKAPQVKIIPKPEGIVINIFSKLVSGVNVADKTREIREKALEIASQKLSLKLIQTNYTATGFVPKDVAREPVKEEKKIEEDKEDINTIEENTPNMNQEKPFGEIENIFEEKKSDDSGKTE